MRIERFEIAGLGHLSSLIADESAGVAAVVDPRRDVDIYLDTARDAGWRITHVVETHLHNDYVSGARDLAEITSAAHVIGAGAALRYAHHGLADGASVDVGRLRFAVLDTPGHTPEHVAYTVADRSRADEPVVLFSGGSLLVGAVGRTDLLGAENAVPYAHAMHRSLHDRILALEDFVGVQPTHGAGSLCSTGISSTPASTIGFERRYNALLAPMDADVFARALLAGQPAVPRYFARMRPTNQTGPALLGGQVPVPASLTPSSVAGVIESGGLVVDARPAVTHVAGHIPGSLSIPADPSFATWLGWMVDLDRPIVLVVDDPAIVDDLVRQSLRIGHDAIAGILDGGIEAWEADGRPVERTGRVSIDDVARALATTGGDERPVVIDVRHATEYEDGHVPGSWHIHAGSLPDRLETLPRDRPMLMMCAAGYRSSIAASLLRSAGFSNVAWVDAGFPAWRAAGHDVAFGSGDGRGPASDDGFGTVGAGTASADRHATHAGATADH